MLVLRESRINKPQSNLAEIDWSHPLTANLEFAALFQGGQSRDLVKSFRGVPSGTQALAMEGAAVAGIGVGTRMGITNSAYYDFPQITSSTRFEGPLTVIWRGIIHSFTNFNMLVTKTDGNGGGSNTIEFRTTSGAGNLNLQVVGGTNLGPVPNLDVVNTLGFSDPNPAGTSALTVDFTVNGVTSAALASAGAPRNSSTGTLKIGQRDDINAVTQFDGTVFNVYIWSRALSAQELAWIHYEPYAFVTTKSKPDIYVTPQPPAPTVLFAQACL